MKLKTYLRGLGIGIIVTAVIMGVALGGKEEQLSDVEIVERARELGMVDKQALLNELENNSAEEEQQTSQPPETEPVQTQQTQEETSEEESQPTEEESTPQAEPESSQEQPGEEISLTISKGDTSVSVSSRLAELGLVASASEYDRFLCDNGYDKKLVTGTYQIPSGSTKEAIAEIITGK